MKDYMNYNDMKISDLIRHFGENVKNFNIEENHKFYNYLHSRLQEEQSFRVLNLTENIGLTNKWIKNLKDSIDNNTDKIIQSNTKLAKSQNFYSWAIIILTTLLFIATAAQAYVVYWTSKPERTIEMYQALKSWSGSLKKQQ